MTDKRTIAVRKRPAFNRRRRTISNTLSIWRGCSTSKKPGIYPARVSGHAFLERGIRDADILIANTAGLPAHGKVAVAVLQGTFRLATLERRNGHRFLLPSGTKEALPVSDDAEIWAIVSSLVREAV